ncbi:MAG: YhbY family RNA-binding protein [Proteobacteria bacterium]|nr:YhbY family RNA-binding protein [Pseudomonadota bacterium]
MSPITLRQRTLLRALAHSLNPVVSIGEAGLSPAIISETDVALKSHELIKIRVHSADRQTRANMLAELCSATDAVAVQHIGRVLVIYRPASPPRIRLT